MNFVYGCAFRMCLLGGFCKSAIFSNSVVVQSGVGVCINMWLHVSRIGLMVVINAYSILGGGWCWFWWIYFERCGYLVIVSWWFGCVKYMLSENCVARCWYSGCSLIVQGIKYILFLFLCVVGWFCSKFGMGPGLGSMSPHNISSLCGGCVL